MSNKYCNHRCNVCALHVREGLIITTNLGYICLISQNLKHKFTVFFFFVLQLHLIRAMTLLCYFLSLIQLYTYSIIFFLLNKLTFVIIILLYDISILIKFYIIKYHNSCNLPTKL